MASSRAPDILGSDTEIELTVRGTSDDNDSARDGPSLQMPTLDEVRSLPPLNFRPPMLQDWALCCYLIYSLFIFGILLALLLKESFHISYGWGYFVIQVLPTVLGTISYELLHSLVTTLTRVTPYMLCASEGASGGIPGATADKTILQGYSQTLGPLDSLKTGNWLLLFSFCVIWLSDFIVSLKAAILNTENYEIAWANHWAIIPLLVIYGFISIHVALVFFWLRRRRTGLRWDPVSIADQLILFRHANFLHKFQGSCIAQRESMIEKLGSLRIRLGYWKINQTYWHGFGAVPGPSKPDDKRQDEAGDHDTANPSADQKRHVNFPVHSLSDIRYCSASGTIRRRYVGPLTATACVLLPGFIVALVLGSRRNNEFGTTLSPDTLSFLVHFLLTFVFTLYTDYWDAFQQFTVLTEPYVALGTTNDGGTAHDSQIPNAYSSLLLGYAGLPSIVVIYTALKRKHKQVARVGTTAMLQRVLPILVASSITVYSPADLSANSAMRISQPFFIIITIWLAIYAVYLPWEAHQCGYSRHLPRVPLSIADLLSWTTSSRLLNLGAPAQSEGDTGDDPFDIRYKANKPRQTQLATGSDPAEQGSVPTRGSERTGDSGWGVEGERWHLEARLCLNKTKFSFGLSRIPASNLHTLGICDSKNLVGSLQPPSSSPVLTFRGRSQPAKGGEEAELGSLSIAGAQNFNPIMANEGELTLGTHIPPMNNAAEENMNQDGGNE